jgi:hypothetical protein
MQNELEVSGYDTVHQFFVEWPVISTKDHQWSLSLRKPIETGAWLFVRRPDQRAWPIPLRVVDCAPVPTGGLYLIRAVSSQLVRKLV